MRELGGHETAADDHQMLGEFLDPHDGVAGVVGHAAVVDRRRHRGTRSRRDDHLIRAELVTGLGTQQIAAVLHAGEPGVAVVDVDIGQPPFVGLAAGCDRVDTAEDPVDDIGPADLVDMRIDPVACRRPYRVGDLGRVDEHLRRYAADVEARAAEGALLAERDAHIAVAGVIAGGVGGDAVARAGTDDGQVVMLHAMAPYPDCVVNDRFWLLKYQSNQASSSR